MNNKTNRHSSYAPKVSLYPLKPEAALSAFMKVDPKRVMAAEKKLKKRRASKKRSALSSG